MDLMLKGKRYDQSQLSTLKAFVQSLGSLDEQSQAKAVKGKAKGTKRTETKSKKGNKQTKIKKTSSKKVDEPYSPSLVPKADKVDSYARMKTSNNEPLEQKTNQQKITLQVTTYAPSHPRVKKSKKTIDPSSSSNTYDSNNNSAHLHEEQKSNNNNNNNNNNDSDHHTEMRSRYPLASKRSVQKGNKPQHRGRVVMLSVKLSETDSAPFDDEIEMEEQNSAVCKSTWQPPSWYNLKLVDDGSFLDEKKAHRGNIHIRTTQKLDKSDSSPGRTMYANSKDLRISTTPNSASRAKRNPLFAGINNDGRGTGKLESTFRGNHINTDSTGAGGDGGNVVKCSIHGSGGSVSEGGHGGDEGKASRNSSDNGIIFMNIIADNPETDDHNDKHSDDQSNDYNDGRHDKNDNCVGDDSSHHSGVDNKGEETQKSGQEEERQRDGKANEIIKDENPEGTQKVKNTEVHCNDEKKNNNEDQMLPKKAESDINSPVKPALSSNNQLGNFTEYSWTQQRVVGKLDMSKYQHLNKISVSLTNSRRLGLKDKTDLDLSLRKQYSQRPPSTVTGPSEEQHN
ncbi:hypothetical protein RFI_32648 [Reticulomyxa filosa]|uniref:Uncharacterized protein n=1 Tax=Reticulomyxa filosa TaxID=46433 RepID=X6LTP3_RETFI|nr:hypothetical protein RFI_32648 [Reticulomyxa filosa]|eukprot:ETO04746.1 hypothetical protein RFI_32648 [Reticulomyxa filosa]